MRKTSIGGIPVTPFRSVTEAAATVIDSRGIVAPGFAVAINAEKVVRAQTDSELMEAIRSAAFCYPDGMSVTWTLSRKGVPSRRIAGCDLWVALMRRAGEFEVPVFLLGALPAVNEATRAKLTSDFATPIVDSCDGYFTDEDEVIDRVGRSGAKVVTVAMGSPQQEQFIRRCHAVYPNVFYLGVGGGYDVYVGTVQRAPVWMQEAGLEWLYRLVRQPSRLRRQASLLRYVVWHLRGRL